MVGVSNEIISSDHKRGWFEGNIGDLGSDTSDQSDQVALMVGKTLSKAK